jgi:hypothetical protein
MLGQVEDVGGVPVGVLGGDRDRPVVVAGHRVPGVE